MNIDQIVILAQVGTYKQVYPYMVQLGEFIKEVKEANQAKGETLYGCEMAIKAAIKTAMLNSTDLDVDLPKIKEAFSHNIKALMADAEALAKSQRRLQALAKPYQNDNRIPYVGGLIRNAANINPDFVLYNLKNEFYLHPEPIGRSSLAGDAKWEFIGT